MLTFFARQHLAKSTLRLKAGHNHPNGKYSIRTGSLTKMISSVALVQSTGKMRLSVNAPGFDDISGRVWQLFGPAKSQLGQGSY